MGTYRNPHMVVTTDAQVATQNSGSSIISDMGSEIRKAAAVNKARRDANWASYKANNEKALGFEQDFIAEGIKNGVDRQQLEEQASGIMRKYAAALNKDSQATGPYEGYEENARFIFQTKQMLKDLPNSFSAMSLNVEEYGDALLNSGQGSDPGQVNYRFTDPRYAAMYNIAKNKPGASGKVSWKTMYSEESGWQWFQVAKGEDIKRINQQMYKSTGDKKYLEDGDEYAVSYTEIKRAQDDADGNKYDNQTFMTNPSIMNDLKPQITAANLIDEETGLVDKRFQKEKFIVRQTTVEGDVGKEVAVQTSPDTEAIKKDPRFRALVKTWAGSLTRFGPNTLSAYIETATKQKNVNGETLFFYTSPEGKDIQVGKDEGYFDIDQSEENSKRNGYSEKDYNTVLGLIENDLLNRIGAFSSGTIERDDTRTKALNVEQRARQAAGRGGKPQKWQLIAKNQQNTINSAMEKLKDESKSVKEKVDAFEYTLGGITQKPGIDIMLNSEGKISVGKRDFVKTEDEIVENGEIVERAKYSNMHIPFQTFDVDDEEGIKKFLEDRIITFDVDNSDEVSKTAQELIKEYQEQK
jgi:hypothetical protein